MINIFLRIFNSYNWNIIVLFILSCTLLGSIIIQTIIGELPCPLCYSQRLGLVLMGAGVLLNLCYGEQRQHHAVILISALFTQVVAARQILLTIQNNSAVGTDIFGFHLYTWAFITALAMILFVSMRLIAKDYKQHVVKSIWTTWVAAFFLIVVFAQVPLVFLQCGVGVCHTYQWSTLGIKVPDSLHKF